MKRFMALCLLFSLVCSLAACGDPAQQGNMPTTAAIDTEGTTDAVPTIDTVPTTGVMTAPETTTESEPEEATAPTMMSVAEFQQFIQKYLDLSKYEIVYKTDNQCRYELKSASQSVIPRNCDIIVCETKIEIGKMKVSELINLGWKPLDQLPEDKYVEAHQWISRYAFQKDGRRIEIAVYNPTDGDVKIPHALVDTVYITNYDADDNYTVKRNSAAVFSVDGKIDQNSTLSDLLEVFGDPLEVIYYRADSEYSHYSYIDLEFGGDVVGYIRIKLSGNGAKIVEFKLCS